MSVWQAVKINVRLLLKRHLFQHGERVACIFGEIMRATEDQSAGIVEINDAIGQMDSVTQQNAARVEQADTIVA